jgi:hypothetical protein
MDLRQGPAVWDERESEICFQNFIEFDFLDCVNACRHQSSGVLASSLYTGVCC